MASKTTKKMVSRGSRPSVGARASQQITTAIERVKKTAKANGAPMSRMEISRLKERLTSGERRRQAKRK
jgi:hypothetical protein